MNVIDFADLFVCCHSQSFSHAIWNSLLTKKKIITSRHLGFPLGRIKLNDHIYFGVNWRNKCGNVDTEESHFLECVMMHILKISISTVLCSKHAESKKTLQSECMNFCMYSTIGAQLQRTNYSRYTELFKRILNILKN